MSHNIVTPTSRAAAPERSPRPDDRPRSRRKWYRRAVGKPSLLVYGFLSFVVLASVFPLYWSFLIGSGDSTTVNDPNMSWIPGGNFVQNVQSVVENPNVNFWPALRNSIIVSGVTAASVVFFSTLAGFAFAKMRFRGRKWLLTAVIATTAVPSQLGVVPLFILMSNFGWTGTLGAVIIPGLVTAFGVFWMTQYVGQTIPDEIVESARVDGASSFTTFWRIILPIVRPAATMLALFTFVATWTNFFWPFIVLNPQNPTLPVALKVLQANYFVDYSIILAGAIFATFPLILLFIVAGKQLVSGVMQGALKG
ncbi:carbohydrate ABC transporter permease [Pseudarthrobacter raffinosi]|uniref:carbohydrate ABC transporter permease n=1 Tax=Pseudarthrobacter raffinosi TaxID=2953651 RepID=UPI00208E1BFD|nr:carbohydrate ABC transporter permease [Pseudarthrobacter sp. MDT3-9]MCO4253266.1 carbohydrate ABC transporter permease [Pseudarthrobacter sp. MDT3-9]